MQESQVSKTSCQAVPTTSGVSISSSGTSSTFCYANLFGQKPSISQINSIDEVRKNLYEQAKTILDHTRKSLSILQAMEKQDYNLALRRACEAGNLSIIRFLSENNANCELFLDYNSKSSNGNTCLDWALLSNNNEVINFIKQSGAIFQKSDSEPQISRNEIVEQLEVRTVEDQQQGAGVDVDKAIAKAIGPSIFKPPAYTNSNEAYIKAEQDTVPNKSVMSGRVINQMPKHFNAASELYGIGNTTETCKVWQDDYHNPCSSVTTPQHYSSSSFPHEDFSLTPNSSHPRVMQNGVLPIKNSVPTTSAEIYARAMSSTSFSSEENDDADDDIYSRSANVNRPF